MEHNFDKCTRCTNQGLAYDLQSVMHYPQKGFSKNGKNTISCKTANPCTIGNRAGFSALDIEGINKLYNCNRGTGVTSGPGVTVPPLCDDDDEYCPTWKNHGFCTEHYVEWMSKHCKKSCDKC